MEITLEEMLEEIIKSPDKPSKGLVNRMRHYFFDCSFSPQRNHKHKEMVEGLVQGVVYVREQLKHIQEFYSKSIDKESIELSLNTTDFVDYALRLSEIMIIYKDDEKKRDLIKIMVYPKGYISFEDKQKLSEIGDFFSLHKKEDVINYAISLLDSIQEVRYERVDKITQNRWAMYLGFLMIKIPFVSIRFCATVDLYKLYTRLEECKYAIDRLNWIVQTDELSSLVGNIERLLELREKIGDSKVTYETYFMTVAMEATGYCSSFSLDEYLRTGRSLEKQSSERRRRESKK